MKWWRGGIVKLKEGKGKPMTESEHAAAIRAKVNELNNILAQAAINNVVANFDIVKRAPPGMKGDYHTIVVTSVVKQI